MGENQLFGDTQNKHQEVNDDLGGSSKAHSKLSRKIKDAIQGTQQNKQEIEQHIWDYIEQKYAPLGGRLYNSNWVASERSPKQAKLTDLTPWIIERLLKAIDEGILDLEGV